MKIVYSQIVELEIQALASGQTFGFVDQPQLRNKRIVAIEAYNVADVSNAPSGNALVSAAIFNQSYLTLYLVRSSTSQSIGEQINQFPLVSLHRVQNGTPTPFVRNLYELGGDYIVSWDKSRVNTGTVITIGGAKVSYLFNVYYIDSK